jgi:hypothetical protein
MKNRAVFAVIGLHVLCSLMLSSCQIEGTTYGQAAKRLTTVMLDGFANDDMDQAYTVINEEYISYSELISISNYLDSVLGKSNYYKMEQVGFNKAKLEGSSKEIFAIIYEISAGGTRVVTMEVAMRGGDVNSICGLDLLDTSYVNSTVDDMKPLNIVLIIYTVLTSLFTLWMFVSCCRRRIAHKRWWALLTLVGAFVRISLLESGWRFFAMLTFILNVSRVAGDIVSAAVNVTVGIPVGAIIYFLMRKKIKDIEEPPQPEDYDPRAAKDGFSDNGWL